MLRVIILLLLLPFTSFAQKKLNLTLFGGFSNYAGDLQDKRFTMDQSNFSFAGGLSYELFPKMLVRGALQFGKLTADDKKGKPTLRDRNLNFTSYLYEGSLLLDYSIFDLQYRKLTPYVFAGVAAFHFNPFTQDATGKTVYLPRLGTEGQGLPEYPDRKRYELNQISLPFGGGIRFRINSNTTLGYEIGLRRTFTDYLDDVSTTYADQAVLALRRGQTAVDVAFRGDETDKQLPYPTGGAIRGGPKFKDWYYFSGITLSIGLTNTDGRLFGRTGGRGSVDCPTPVL